MLTDTTALDTRIEELQSEIEVVTELIRQCVDENARTGLDQTEYQKRYNGLLERYEKAKEKLKKIEQQRRERRVKREQLDVFLETLVRQDSILTEFDETLWYAVIDKVTVYTTDDVQFTFRYGSVIKA